MIAAVADITREIDRAFYIITAICIVLFVVITVAMVVFVIRYHHSRTRTTAQIRVNYPLEITWTVIPTAIVIFMFFIGYEGFRILRSPPPDAKIVRVIGQQWVWSFFYPEEQITSERLVLPVGRAVKFELETRDVIHSFYLPAFRVKEDMVPGRDTFLWLEPQETGTYTIFCAEFCGKGHATMIAEMDVVTLEQYEQWVRDKIAERYRPIVVAEAMDPNSQAIRQRNAPALFLTYCAVCHGERGEGGLVENARNFQDPAGWVRSPTVPDVFRTLTEGIEGTRMNSFRQLPAPDRFALAHHVRSFLPPNQRPEAPPQTVAALVDEYDLEKPPAPPPQIDIEEAIETFIRETERGPAPQQPPTTAPGTRHNGNTTQPQ